MKWYPWLRPHFEQLITSYQTMRGHHALLVQALPGMGDDTLLYAIARFLVCQHQKRYKSCGKCRACQLMQAETHPDYYRLRPRKGESIIGIDAIREVSEKLYAYACLSGEKVVHINNIALLTEAAVSALLKTLEEPPEGTWFLFSCQEPERLIATLRSRCCLHRLVAPQEKWALTWLKRQVRVSESSAIAALRLCSGAPVAALELLQKNSWIQRTTLCSALANALESQDWLSLLTVLNHEQAPLRLQWVIALLLDALKLQQGVTAITNVDIWPLVNRVSEVLTAKTLHAIIHVLWRCHKQLLTITSLNYELMLADCLLIIEYYLQLDGALPTFHL